MLTSPLLPSGQYCGHGVAICQSSAQTKIAPSYFTKIAPSYFRSTCGGIHSEKRKGRKNQFLFTAQLFRKTNLADIFSKSRSGTIPHKNKKNNYGSHPIPLLTTNHPFFSHWFVVCRFWTGRRSFGYKRRNKIFQFCRKNKSQNIDSFLTWKMYGGYFSFIDFVCFFLTNSSAHGKQNIIFAWQKIESSFI